MTILTSFPKISIVTPSFNQGKFLEATIRSVLDQKYPNLEYILMDGGSTDASSELIRRYREHFAYAVSARDRGQFNAINEGFKHATGDIFAYLNSDDVYLPWTFRTVAEIFSKFPQIQWLTSRTLLILNAQGIPAQTYPAVNYARTWFYRGWSLRQLGGQSGWIQQEATFWRRELWEKAGSYMDESLAMAGDFELWARFWQHANLVTIPTPLAGFRKHDTNKSGSDFYPKECWQVLARYPHQGNRNDKQRWLLEQLLKRTGRGGKRWGSTANWLQYDLQAKAWVLHSKFVI
jgi:hypothetical protein